MSKLSKLIKAVSILVKKPYLINKIIKDDDIHRDIVLKSNFELKNGFKMLDLLDILPNMNIDINTFSFLNGGSLITDLALLKGIVNQKKDCNYFEIGTWRGESVANIASLAKKSFTLNLSNDELRKLGYKQEYLNQQGFFSNHLENVIHLKGNSFEFDFSPYYNKCDVVFIDGDHQYKSVLNDTKIAFKLLKNEDSIIVWHDYARNPGKIRWDVLRGIYDSTPNDKKNNLYCVSNTLCAIYTNSPTPVIDNKKITPTKKFNVTITSEKI